MADVNKVILIGRLTRDPQLKYIPGSNTPVCEFGFAVGRRYKTASGESREESTFIDCAILGRGAEVFNQYMAKGRQCYLEGRLKLDQWEDKSGGGKRSKLSVVVETFQFLGEGRGATPSADHSESDPEQGVTRTGTKYNQGRSQKSDPSPPYESETSQFSDDDIPF
ncbi:MAG: single-stranded DNA-binding protein [Phycisphaerae bacterium]|jgi:single-strand DNA-binding protein|nr:MAG: single-stranded DNA-binding protein [Phycisphaerae bacterium]